MSDLNLGGQAKRLASDAAGTGRAMFAPVRKTAPKNDNKSDETLIWLAGDTAPERRVNATPTDGASDLRADAALSELRPRDPILAAQRRASILAGLRRESPDDLRVQAVFETDPIIAEDMDTGNLVTRGMLTARLDLIDAVLTMLGHSVLSRGMRSRAMVTLKTAYPALDDDAQVEWAMSQVRLEECKVFMGQRTQDELNTLGGQVSAIYDRADIWDATRAFSMAAHIGVGQARGSGALADLLEMRKLPE